MGDETSTPLPPIFDEVAANDLVSVKRRVEEEHFPLTQKANVNKETVAHVAAKEKNLSMLKYFLGKEPDLLAARNKFYDDVLTLGIVGGAMDMVKYLVDELKADIYHPHNQRFGNVAIHIAAEENQTEILKYLIEEKHVDVNLKNDLQETPIFLAVEKSCMDALKYLVEKTSANVTALDSNNDNILYSTAMNGDLDMAKYLLDERKIHFDINWQDRFGRTIVYVATRFNKLDFIKYCVEGKGASIHIANSRGWTPLFEATYLGNLDVMKYLMDRGADMNLKDRGNQTLEVIAGQGNPDPAILDLLNRTRHERVRRNVPDPINLANSFPTYEPYGVPSLDKMIGAHISQPSYGPAHSTFSNDVGVSRLEIFLAFANTVFGYTKNSLSWERYEALLSPEEMIRARVDLEAERAIHRLPDVFY